MSQVLTTACLAICKLDMSSCFVIRGFEAHLPKIHLQRGVTSVWMHLNAYMVCFSQEIISDRDSFYSCRSRAVLLLKHLALTTIHISISNVHQSLLH